jgi:hypothetical protein
METVPELSEIGVKQAQETIGSFKKMLSKEAEKAIGELYCDVIPFIESDAWANFRTHVLNGLKNYPSAALRNKYDFASIRKQMFVEFREEIIKDLNQDLLNEVESLKQQIEDLKEFQHNFLR